MDSNGYNPSILDTKPDVCYISRIQGECARHEIYFGKNRRISKENGFWVYLNPNIHTALHGKDGETLDMMLKQDCQRVFEKTHTREEFISLIGKSYF